MALTLISLLEGAFILSQTLRSTEPVLDAGTAAATVVRQVLGSIDRGADPTDGRAWTTGAATDQLSDDVIAPVLEGPALAELAEFGDEEDVAAGDVLYRAGDASYDFFVVLAGQGQIVRRDTDGEGIIVTYGPGGFLGELSLLTGQRPYLSGRVSESGRVLRIPREAFRRLMGEKPELADLIFNAFSARREILRAGDGARAIRIVGSRYSADAMALRAFATRSHLPHEWIDLEESVDPDVVLAGMGLRPADAPAVITPTAVLRHTSPGEFAEHLGLTFRPVPGTLFDLVVIGTGPADWPRRCTARRKGSPPWRSMLSPWAARPAPAPASRTTSGSPTGSPVKTWSPAPPSRPSDSGPVSNAPCNAAGLRSESGIHVVTLEDGSEIPCRSVIVATGARYRRLAVDDLQRFEGAGVYYAATDLEARICTGRDVIVVGGGTRRDRPPSTWPSRAARSWWRSGERISPPPCRGTWSSGSRPTPHRGPDPHRGAGGQRPEPSGAGFARAHPDGHDPDRRLRGVVLLHRRRAGDDVVVRSRRPRPERVRPDRPRPPR